MKYLCVVVVLAGFCTGCADVQPWERGNLAKPHMALTPDPVNAALRAHKFASREAASGGGDAEGGGCGCN